MIVQDTKCASGESAPAARGLVPASKHKLDNVSATIKAVDFEELERRLTEVERKAAAH
jgi:hypothetical protein